MLFEKKSGDFQLHFFSCSPLSLANRSTLFQIKSALIDHITSRVSLVPEWQMAGNSWYICFHWVIRPRSSILHKALSLLGNNRSALERRRDTCFEISNQSDDAACYIGGVRENNTLKLGGRLTCPSRKHQESQ